MRDVEFANVWPLLAYAAAVTVLVGAMLALSWLLGERHRDRATGEPFEGGIAPTGTARQRCSVQFYLVAMLFVIFDLEAVFLFAWAVAARDVGWAGYVEMVVFVVILGAALVYLWRLGALDWSAGRRIAPREVRRPPRGARGQIAVVETGPGSPRARRALGGSGSHFGAPDELRRAA